ncbi:MAG: hypothetical protein U9R37_09280 [Campylobacterota bacterium]|nr:hypothetical protein [Campylobacterota bacterium]
MKKSIVLFELILSIAIFSIIALYSTKYIFSLYKKNNDKAFITHNNILLETTRLFLIKNNDFTKLRYENENLYYDNNLLLNHISTFNITTNSDIGTFDICLYEDKICQEWKINR